MYCHQRSVGANGLMVPLLTLHSIHKHDRLSAIDLNCRHHEAELRHSREECWAREQELANAREKLAHLKATLEDRRKDVVSYKVTLLIIHNAGLLWLLRERHKKHMSSNANMLTGTVLSCSQAEQSEQAGSLCDYPRGMLLCLST